MNKPDRDRGIVRNTSEHRWLTSYMKKGENTVKFANGKAALNTFLGIFVTIIALEIAVNVELYLPLTGSRWLLIDCDCLDQTGHDEIEVWKRRSQKFFMLLSESEAECLLVCPALHLHVQYRMAKMKKLTELLRLKEVATWRCVVSFRNFYQQHKGCGWRGSHRLRYHTYLINRATTWKPR